MRRPLLLRVITIGIRASDALELRRAVLVSTTPSFSPFCLYLSIFKRTTLLRGYFTVSVLFSVFVLNIVIKIIITGYMCA